MVSCTKNYAKPQLTLKFATLSLQWHRMGVSNQNVTISSTACSGYQQSKHQTLHDSLTLVSGSSPNEAPAMLKRVPCHRHHAVQMLHRIWKFSVQINGLLSMCGWQSVFFHVVMCCETMSWQLLMKRLSRHSGNTSFENNTIAHVKI